MLRHPVLILFVMIALTLASRAGAVALAQIDTFEDGTTANWSSGLPDPNPPVNVATGGPAGDEDNYLLITSNGAQGPGGKLVVFNHDQWTGDYPTAEVTGISMNVNNLGATTLYLRLLISDLAGAGTPTNSALTPPFEIAAGSGWLEAIFSLDPQDLIVLNGTAEQALANAVEVRFFSNENPAFPPPPVAAQLGVDNIRSLPLPSPVEQSSWGKIKSYYGR